MIKKKRHIWQIWANKLHRWGLREFTASFLEALGPLTIIGAQAFYLGQPLLQTFFSNDDLSAVTQLLEDPDQSRTFITFLRENN
jgi:hypothetical protein